MEGPLDVRVAALERLLQGGQPVPEPLAVALVDAYDDDARAADAARVCREALARDPASAGLVERLVDLDGAAAVAHLERVLPGLPRQESSAPLCALVRQPRLCAAPDGQVRVAEEAPHELRPDADWLDAMALLEAQARARPDDAYAWDQLAAGVPRSR